MNSQFQLGLELTNIFNPLAQAVTALGSLALVDAIKKGGSDALTELKMASILGRNKIDSAIEVHFNQAVARLEKTAISQYLEDILLESGAGPTVQNALKNPELLSMVIQLSALCYVHEIQSLASALVEAIDRSSQLLRQTSDAIPDYVSLCGTLRAIQQETVSFHWSSLFERVEMKIKTSIERAQPGRSRRDELTLEESADSVLFHRQVPFSVLQTLLISLSSLQHFPEERLLSIDCTSGITTLVVWCYHILGLHVKVDVHGSETCFGNGRINVVINQSDTSPSTASLLVPNSQDSPLFSLTSASGDPVMDLELRVNARGFGNKVLENSGLARNLNAEVSRTWVIQRSFSAGMLREKPNGR